MAAERPGDLLVGIDLGSTHLKAVVYDTAGSRVASASRPTERHHPDPEHPAWTVWDPDQIWGGTADALREAVSRLPDPKRIRGVAVTGMGMDGLPVDEEGTWLYPFISWLDPRTEPQQRWWLERVGAERQFAITGNQLWPITAALRMRWLAEHEPALMARADKWLMIEDFLNLKLCGRRATDASMASNTLLFDQRTRTWSEELIALSGIDRRILCDPLPSGTPLGEVSAEAARRTGLPEGTPVILGGHDYLCAALPTGAFHPGTILDVGGTWEILVASLPEPVLTPRALETGVIVEAHVARGLHAAMCASVAADALEWARRACGFSAGGADDAGWDEVIAAARRSPPGARGATFLPHLSGSTCPRVDPRSLGAFVGLRSHASRDDLTRAVIEGLGYQFREILEALEDGLGARADRIVAVGGMVRNDFWMQVKADISGKPIEVPEVEEATALGAAILAGIGTGIYLNEEDALDRVRRPGKTYEPDLALARGYGTRYECWRRMYPALREVHWDLFDAGAK